MTALCLHRTISSVFLVLCWISSIFLKWYFACNLDATLLLSCAPWPSLWSTPRSEGTHCADANAWEIVEARSNEGLQSRSLKEFPPLSCPINVSKSELLLLLCMLQQQRCTERFSSALRPSHRLGDWLVPGTFPLCQGSSLQLGKSKMWALGLGIQISAISRLASLGTSGWLFLEIYLHFCRTLLRKSIDWKVSRNTKTLTVLKAVKLQSWEWLYPVWTEVAYYIFPRCLTIA